MPTPDSGDSTDLEDLLTEAEAEKEKLSERNERLRDIEDKLTTMVKDLERDEALTEDEAAHARAAIERREFAEVRETIREAKQSLDLDDSEKDAFADAFKEAHEDLRAATEQVATALLDLDHDHDRDDLVDLLYGRNHDLTKRDIQAVFDSFEKVPDGGLSAKEQARVLSSFHPELNITTTTQVIKALQQEMNERN